MCGVSHVGDTRQQPYNLDTPTEYRWQLGPPEIRYYWTVHVSGEKFVYFHVNSSICGIDRLLAIIGPEDLECILNRWKPAHTEIVYDFSPLFSLDFTQGFNTQYLAMGMM
jgi:uncharacterized protein YmfQ (DUF2313 family)